MEITEIKYHFEGTEKSYLKLKTALTKEDLIYKPLWFHKRNLQQTRSSYGSKLSTEYMFKYNNRLKRIYITIFSNSGSMFFVHNKKRVYVDIY